MRVRRGRRNPPEMDPTKVGKRPSLKKILEVARKAAPPEFVSKKDGAAPVKRGGSERDKGQLRGALGPKYGEKPEGAKPARTVKVAADLNVSSRNLNPEHRGRG